MRARVARVLEADLDRVVDPVRRRVMLFRLFIAIGGRLRALMDRRLASSEITTQQAALLAVAGAAETAPTQGELASYLGVSHQNIRQLTDALERKGFLEVRVDETDRRAKRIAPTKAAAAMFARRNRGDFDAVTEWFSDLEDRDIDFLLDRLGRLLDSLLSAGGPAPVVQKAKKPRRASA